MNAKTRSTPHLINIVGIDGAGKTTLAKQLVRRFQGKGYRFRYVYSQYKPVLLAPFKWIARSLFMKGQDEFSDYETYIDQKQSTSRRLPVISTLYAMIWMFDYGIQLVFKVALPRLMGVNLVIDRYVYDSAVNLSITLNRSCEWSERLARYFLFFLPAPDRVVFLDCPETVAFSRKDDIQSLRYLRERRERYQFLASRHQWRRLDGTHSVSVLAEQLSSAVMGNERQEGRAPRILYIHANNDEVGGADYCLLKMALEVHRHGFVPVVLLRKRTAIHTRYQQMGIDVLYAPIVRLQKNARTICFLPWTGIKTLWLITSIIKKESISLVHTNDLLDFTGNLAARLAGVPSIQHVRMIIDRPGVMNRLLSGLSRLWTDRILCVSKGVQRVMYGKETKIRVLYDWLDMQSVGHDLNRPWLRQELGLPPTAPLIGCVGRLEPWKGQHLFLQAANKVAARYPRAHFCIIGGTTTGKERYRKHLETLHAACLYRNRIHFLGHRQDISGLMRELTLLVHTSIEPDPLPGVVMEAMANRTVVIGPRAGGVPEEIGGEDRGYLYTRADPVDLERKLVQALENASLARMEIRAQQHIQTTFHKERLVSVLLKQYRDVLHDDRGVRLKGRVETTEHTV